MKLLVVDDEPLICHGLCRMLSELDEVTEIRNAFSGAEALELMQTYSPDMVLTDIRMPGMDGLEFIRRARAAFPCDRFYVLTNYAHFQYAKEAIALGVRGYLLKPVERDELFEAVRQTCEQLAAEADSPASPAAALLENEPSMAYALTRLMTLALSDASTREEALALAEKLVPANEAARTLRDAFLHVPWEGKSSRSLRELLLSLLREQPYRSPLSIAAEKVSLHPGYVSTVLTQRLGVGYSNLVNCVRVAQAQHLLLSDGDLSVTAVCERCGFENANHFFRVFKQWTGITPKEYRVRKREK